MNGSADPPRKVRGAARLAEGVRILLLFSAAGAVMLPFFTTRLVGGTDVRWYAYVLKEFLNQTRAGRFPVFLGQGRLVWNGGIHPFRSAPLYLHLAAAWHVLTFGTLGVYALQHLEAITCAAAGALGFYAAGATLAPRRRWEVWTLALLYVSSPAWLSVLYLGDAYMTFTALAVLPLALYGNARLLLSSDGRGGGALAAGLALTWMAHPPVALLATMATLFLQGGAWVLGDHPAERARGALISLLLFAGFGAYYFAGMSELPPPLAGPAAPALQQFAGGALVLAGLGQAVLKRRGWLWLTLLAPGGWLLWLSCVPWLWWMAVTAVLLLLALLAGRRWRLDPAQRAAEIFLSCLVVGAGLTQAWLGPVRPERNLGALAGLAGNQAQMRQLFPFVPGGLLHPQVDFEPGLGTWLVLALVGSAFLRRKALAVQLFFFVGLLFAFSLARVPGLSDFFVGYFPDYFAEIISYPLLIRILPAMMAFVLMGGVAWLATLPEGRSHRIYPLVLLGGAAVLGAWQAARFVAYGWRITSGPELTRRPFFPENLVLERFNYDLLPMPWYFSNGPVDPRLEFRLLDANRRIYLDPDSTARRMEGTGATVLRLNAVQVPENRRWLRIVPGLTVAPGEELLLRFEFDPNRTYAGVLVFRSEHGYREYRLPADGLDYGFGVRPGWSHVIALWNSGSAPEHYAFDVPAQQSPNPGVEGYFATMTVSRYDDALRPLRVEGLDPCRVTVVADRPGWLETPRVFLPGYVATVDGRPAPLASSGQHLVMIPLSPGRHVVVLRYRGTARVWFAAVVSLVTWTGWLGLGWRRHRRS